MNPVVIALGVVAITVVLVEGAVRRASPQHPLRPSIALETVATASINFFYRAGRYIASILDITEVIRDVFKLGTAAWTLAASPLHFFRGWITYWNGRTWFW